MAQIEVNHKTLETAAQAVSDYCKAQERSMRSADSSIKDMLSTGWLGLDAQEFGGKWELVDEKDSVTKKFQESLMNFSEGLSACANEYKNAQTDIYNAANRLPKVLYW